MNHGIPYDRIVALELQNVLSHGGFMTNPIDLSAVIPDYIEGVRKNFHNVERIQAIVRLNAYEPWDKRTDVRVFGGIAYAGPTDAWQGIRDDRIMYLLWRLPREHMSKFVGAYWMIEDGAIVRPHYVAHYRKEFPGAINPYGGQPLDHTELDPVIGLHPIESSRSDREPWEPRRAYFARIIKA